MREAELRSHRAHYISLFSQGTRSPYQGSEAKKTTNSREGGGIFQALFGLKEEKKKKNQKVTKKKFLPLSKYTKHEAILFFYEQTKLHMTYFDVSQQST